MRETPGFGRVGSHMGKGRLCNFFYRNASAPSKILLEKSEQMGPRLSRSKVRHIATALKSPHFHNC